MCHTRDASNNEISQLKWSFLILILIINLCPELKTLEWNIINPNRLIYQEINNKRRTISRLRKRVDQALIPISTI